MIRTNAFGVAMVSALFLLALLCCWLAGWWFLGARELQLLKSQFQWMNRTTSTVQALADESADYSRRNPAIVPILDQYGVKVPLRPAPAANPAPVPKPGR